eukprot:evm.model.scf_178.7 EVM.evm.TU.scf_178.7   scf_178:70630-75639(+)
MSCQVALDCLLGYVPRVVHLGASSIDGIWKDIQKIADALGVHKQGAQFIQSLQRQVYTTKVAAMGRGVPKVAVFQCMTPFLAAPPWASELIRLLGAEDALEEAEKCAGSPLERLKSSSDVVIFALQGLKLNEAAAQVKRTLDTLSDGGPSRARMAVVDGSRVLCQPGPSISESLEVLLEVLHPEAQPFGHQGELWRSLGREMA